MKYTAAITPRNSARTSILLLCLPVSLGILIGSLYAVKSTAEPTPWLHQYFSPVYSGNTLLEVLRNTFVSSALYVAAAFLTGFSAVGQPFGPCMLVYRGFGIGESVALLYAAYGTKAVPSLMLLTLPKAIAVTAVSILSVRELMRSSKALLYCFVNGEAHEACRRNSFKLYCLKFIVLLLISVFIAAADAALNYFFRSELLH